MVVRTRGRLVAAALLGVLASAGTAAPAFITYNLTGTWTGTIKCNDLVGGAKQKSVLTPTMKISQVGLNFGVLLDFGGSTRFYGGLANADLKKPEQKGEAALILCGTDPEVGIGFDEIVRVAVSKADKPKAGLKGTSIFSNPIDGIARHHGTCKWKFTRTDQVDPNIQVQCGEPSLTLPPSDLGRGVR